MGRKSLVALFALAATVACGGTSQSSAAQGLAASTVAAQPADVPKGMVKCDISGDLNKYISAEETADPTTAKATKADWQDAQKNGATAAYVSLFSDSTNQCAALKKASSDVTATTHPLLVNFVIKFKDEQSAAKGYNNPKKIFGFSAADLRDSKQTSQQPVLEGAKTGLTDNSIVLSTAVQTQSFYIAVWQNKEFMVFLAILNMDPAASKKVATSENSRIK
jgi:hypothetical protein